MKKVLFIWLLFNVLTVKAQDIVVKFTPDHLIEADSSFIDPLYPLTSEEQSKATQLIHSMEVSTQSGDAYTIKAFQIDNWDAGDFQYVEIYKGQKKIYEMSNGDSWINFPSEYSGDSSSSCCYVAQMGKDAVALVFHEMTYGSNQPHMTIVTLKGNQASLVYNRECGIYDIKCLNEETSISFTEYVPNLYDKNNTPCKDTKKIILSKEGIHLTRNKLLQDHLKLISLNLLPFTQAPYNETKNAYHQNSYAFNSFNQIPNRLYRNLQCTEFSISDKEKTYHNAYALFRSTEANTYMVAVELTENQGSKSEALITINKNGKLLDTLEVAAGYKFMYMKQYRILEDKRIVVTSLKPKQKESIPVCEFGSFTGHRVDCTYKVENGKFVLENEQVFKDQVYTEKCLSNPYVNIWYDPIEEHEGFSLQEAKDYFNSKQPMKQWVLKFSISPGKFTPYWEYAVASVNGDLMCYEIPIKSTLKYNAILLNAHFKAVDVYQKLLIIKNAQTGYIQMEFLSYVPDADYEEIHHWSVESKFIDFGEKNHFSGLAIYSCPFSDTILGAGHYVNGNIEQGVSMSEDEDMDVLLHELQTILKPYKFFRSENNLRQMPAEVNFNWEHIKNQNTNTEETKTKNTANVKSEAQEFVDYGYRHKFITYLIQNVRYPSELIQAGVQGKVVIETVVTKEGDLTQTKVVEGIHPLLDNEVLRVVNEMPKGILFKAKKDWKYTFPIMFEIKDNRVQISM